MLQNFLYAAGSAAIVFLVMVYNYEIRKPVDQGIQDRSRDLKYEWFDFIRANIYQSHNAWHCHQCRKLIVLFDLRYRKETPPAIFNEWINTLYNVLDTKYKTILKEDEGLSNLNSQNVLNVLI